MPGLLTLRSDRLAVDLEPGRGGTIRQITLLAGSQRLLYEAGWEPQVAASASSLSGEEWTAQYVGGWQTLVPNGGDECVVDGVRHGWHGESSVAAWTVLDADSVSCRMECVLTTAPLRVERVIRVLGDRVLLCHTVTNIGAADCTFMWAEHAAFGGDLLRAGAAIDSNATSISIDPRHKTVGAAVDLGSRGTWPLLSSADGGVVDLREPGEGVSLLAYLGGFPEAAWASLTRQDGLGIVLVWGSAHHPHMWLWIETGGASGPPWSGRARVVGLEPASSLPAHGLAAIDDAQRFRLRAGETASTDLTVHVAAEPGRVLHADHESVVRAATAPPTTSA